MRILFTFDSAHGFDALELYTPLPRIRLHEASTGCATQIPVALMQPTHTRQAEEVMQQASRQVTLLPNSPPHDFSGSIPQPHIFVDAPPFPVPSPVTLTSARPSRKQNQSNIEETLHTRPPALFSSGCLCHAAAQDDPRTVVPVGSKVSVERPRRRPRQTASPAQSVLAAAQARRSLRSSMGGISRWIG
jgi:hypothetical protein